MIFGGPCSVAQSARPRDAPDHSPRRLGLALAPHWRLDGEDEFDPGCLRHHACPCRLLIPHLSLLGDIDLAGEAAEGHRGVETGRCPGLNTTPPARRERRYTRTRESESFWCCQRAAFSMFSFLVYWINTRSLSDRNSRHTAQVRDTLFSCDATRRARHGRCGADRTQP
jgi:hypothetical protein